MAKTKSMKINRKQTRQIKPIIEELISNPLYNLWLLSPLPLESSASFSCFRLPPGPRYVLFLIYPPEKSSEPLNPYKMQTEPERYTAFTHG